MTAVRKIIAFFVVIGIAMPSLVSVIWSTGTTKAVLQPEFIAEVPQDVVKQIPTFVEQFTVAAKAAKDIKDPNARAWIQALQKVKTTPAELFKQIGIYDWLKGELSATLKQIGQMLKGEVAPGKIILSNKSLKKALSHPAFHKYIKDVLAQLPACQPAQKQVWEKALREHRDPKDKLPACNPGVEVTQGMIRKMVAAVVLIPEQVSLLKNDVPLALQVIRMVGSLLWLAFLVPVLLLLLGAWIGGTSSKSFLRWFSVPVMVASLFPLAMSSFVRNITLLALRVDPEHWGGQFKSAYFTPEMKRAFLEQTAPLIEKIISPIMSSVTTVATVSLVVGVVLFVLSFVATGKTDANTTVIKVEKD